MDNSVNRPRLLDRTTPPHIMTLIMATAFGSITLNLFLPSLPGIARYYEADYALAQLAVSLFLAANACFQPVIGPLSDRYGRRPVIIAFVALAVAATVGAIFATSIYLFLFFRILQGSSAAGMVISRAAVRDTVGMAEAASKIGYITMAMALAPMVGPIIGGWLDEQYGWQSTFWLVAAFGMISLLLIFVDLGETNQHRGESFASQFASYPELLKSRRFWGYSATATFSSGAFFSFLGGGPYLASVHYGLSPSQYGLYFAFAPIGYITGNFLAGRFSRRFGVNQMMTVGAFAISVGMVLALLIAFSGIDSPLAFFGCMTSVGLGNGIALPNSMAGIVSVRPKLAGAASGLGGFLQLGGAALLSILAGIVVGPQSGPVPLILLMLLCSLASLAASVYVNQVAVKEAALP